jgi:hypothetical protein
VLAQGDSVYHILNQPITVVLPMDLQLVTIGLAWSKAFVGWSLSDVQDFRSRLLTVYDSNKELRGMVSEVVAVESFYELVGKLRPVTQRIIELCRVNKA